MPFRVVELCEGNPATFPDEMFSRTEALLLRSSGLVDLEFPNFGNGQLFTVMPRRVVGHIPISADLALHIGPKTSVANVFRLLEVAYNLPSFRFLAGTANSESLEDIFERLAHVFARKIIDRARQGLYKAYYERVEDLPYVRGTIDIGRTSLAVSMGKPVVRCRYQTQSDDNEDNQLLLWTVGRILRSPLCREEVRLDLRRAYRALVGAVTLKPFTAADCVGRSYNRLNQDYLLLHGLCRFFLSSTGPAIERGPNVMLPFQLDVSQLFEQFLAIWLQGQLGHDYRVQAQHRADVTASMHFRMDIVVSRSSNAQQIAVLDTKYKVHERPSNADVEQIVAYATRLGVSRGILVYPFKLADPFVAPVGPVQVHALSFDLAEEVNQAGARFLEQLTPLLS